MASHNFSPYQLSGRFQNPMPAADSFSLEEDDEETTQHLSQTRGQLQLKLLRWSQSVLNGFSNGFSNGFAYGAANGFAYGVANGVANGSSFGTLNSNSAAEPRFVTPYQLNGLSASSNIGGTDMPGWLQAGQQAAVDYQGTTFQDGSSSSTESLQSTLANHEYQALTADEQAAHFVYDQPGFVGYDLIAPTAAGQLMPTSDFQQMPAVYQPAAPANYNSFTSMDLSSSALPDNGQSYGMMEQQLMTLMDAAYPLHSAAPAVTEDNELSVPAVVEPVALSSEALFAPVDSQQLAVVADELPVYAERFSSVSSDEELLAFVAASGGSLAAEDVPSMFEDGFPFVPMETDDILQPVPADNFSLPIIGDELDGGMELLREFVYGQPVIVDDSLPPTVDAAEAAVDNSPQPAVPDHIAAFFNNFGGSGEIVSANVVQVRDGFKGMLPASVLGSITTLDNKDARELSEQPIATVLKDALTVASKHVQSLHRMQQPLLSDDAIFDPAAVFQVLQVAPNHSAAVLGSDGLTLARTYLQNESAAKVVVRLVMDQQLALAQARPDGGFPVASGHVYVYKEGGPIRRWTDDRCWTPSRKGKNKFINIYREVKQLSPAERKEAAKAVNIRRRKPVPDGQDEQKKKQCQEANLAGKTEDIRHEPVTLDNCEKLLFVEPIELAFGSIAMDSAADDLVGPLTHCNNLLIHGLVKRTFKVQHDGDTFTVVNYYNIRDVLNSVISPLLL
ncbi:Global transcription regulator sge1 [Sporothrix epigloea]|uniref:Global transcription regulator sge1 n=1 Tax=Sporothrix epigloea TaxID=1892477 RepID=A0ABP0E1H9_9PEZI